LPADFPELAGSLVPHLFDTDLEAANGRGEFRAQTVLVDVERIDGGRRRLNQIPRRQSRGASVHERDEHQHKQASGTDSDADQHE
jgi:hypothetical protein